VNFSDFIAWMLWRGIYWSKLPRIEKKLRVAIDWALDVFFSKDFVQYLHQRAPTMSRSENQPPPPSSAACDRAAASQKQP
jgi:NADH:ubiquinone reductase (H+-translocating)